MVGQRVGGFILDPCSLRVQEHDTELLNAPNAASLVGDQLHTATSVRICECRLVQESWTLCGSHVGSQRLWLCSVPIIKSSNEDRLPQFAAPDIDSTLKTNFCIENPLFHFSFMIIIQ